MIVKFNALSKHSLVLGLSLFVLFMIYSKRTFFDLSHHIDYCRYIITNVKIVINLLFSHHMKRRDVAERRIPDTNYASGTNLIPQRRMEFQQINCNLINISLIIYCFYSSKRSIIYKK